MEERELFGIKVCILIRVCVTQMCRFINSLFMYPWDLCITLYTNLDFPSGSDSKVSTYNAGSMPGSGRSPGEGNGNPLQYSCLENLMDLDLPCSSDSKDSAYNAGDLCLIPGSGRSSGEGNGNPLQYSCLENPMDRGAWQATVHGVPRSWTWLSN